MQRIAMIDIGSNSARLVINRIHSDYSYNMIYNQKETLRLSQKVDDKGMFTADGIKTTVNTLNNFVHMCKLFKADKILAVCTAAIRNAKNSEAVIAELQKQTHIPVRVITGEEEANYAFLGAISSLDIQDALFFDLGGGSVELILVRDRRVVFSISLPIGTVNTTDKFPVDNKVLPENDNNYKKMCECINKALNKVAWIKDLNLPLVGIGGTARTLAKIIQRRNNYNYYKLHNYQFTYEMFADFFSALKKTPRNGRYRIPGLSADRADIILAGASIIDALFKTAGAKEFITSGYGVRDGLFYEYYFSVIHNDTNVMDNVLTHSIKVAQDLYHLDCEHAARVTGFAEKMFKAWYTLHRLPKNYEKILQVAGELHDIGVAINYYNHEQHSAYLIESIQLFGVTHFEQMLSAVVACWHNGISQGYFKHHVYNDVLKEQDWQNARKLAVILTLAEALDYSEVGAVKDIDVSFGKNGSVLVLVESADEQKKPSVEIAQVRSKANLFKKEFGVELIVGIK